MRAKPDMKPWVNRGHKNYELRRSGTITRAFVLRLGSAAPLGLNKCIDHYYPGLAPWAMKSVALAGLMYVVTTHQLLDCFDVLAGGLGVGL